MVPPSGENAGSKMGPGVAVIFWGVPPTGGTRQRSLASSSSRSACRAETKTIDRPSGAHTGSASMKSPSVTCRGGAPSSATTNTWGRRS